MCGIAGYVCTGEFDPRLNAALPMLGIFMTDRGKQSWGWTNGKDIHKAIGTVRGSFSADLLGYKSAMIHTRHATTGAVVAENSHPFSIKGIIGVHNGMIYNHDELDRAHKTRDCKVDSEHIFHHLADGLDLSELEGYGAVVFWRDGVLHLGRFNNGDMILAKTDFGWVYASTKEAIEDSLAMSGLLGTRRFYVTLKEGILYQLIGDKIVKTKTKLNVSQGFSNKTWQNSGYYSSSSYTPYKPPTGKMVDGKWVWDDTKKPTQNLLPIPEGKVFTANDKDMESIYEAYLANNADTDEGGRCDACGFFAGQLVWLQGSSICEECLWDYKDDAEDGDIPELSLLSSDFEVTDAVTLDPNYGQIKCDDCGTWVTDEEPVYICKASADYKLCRHCFRDEYLPEAEEEVADTPLLLM